MKPQGMEDTHKAPLNVIITIIDSQTPVANTNNLVKWLQKLFLDIIFSFFLVLKMAQKYNFHPIVLFIYGNYVYT